VLFKKNELSFGRISDSGQIEQCTANDIKDASIEYVFVEVDSSKNRRGTGFALGMLMGGGLAGGLAGSMAGYGKKETSIEFSHCRFSCGETKEQLYYISPEEMLMIWFVINSV